MNKEKLMVEAIRNGIVLDHIPSDKLFKIVSILQLDKSDTPITIGNNLESKQVGRKGIIKITNRFFSDDEINKIAILAPNIRLNVIKDYQVTEKRYISLPPEVHALVRCSNPKYHKLRTNGNEILCFPCSGERSQTHLSLLWKECIWRRL